MSKIEWTDKTWNPTTGCNKVSAGCRGCYAEVMHKRLKGMGQKKYQQDFLKGVVTHGDALEYPFTIKKPTTFFVNSMSDLFHKDVPFEFIAKVFIVMALNPQHTFQILTKRPERAVEYFTEYEYNGFGDDRTTDELVTQFDHLLYDPKTHQLYKRITDAGWFWDRYPDDDSRLIFDSNAPASNIWIGTSCENQETANERIPLLLQIPAAVRFLSCEPLLGPINFNTPLNRWIETQQNLPEYVNQLLGWVIVGGESGHSARPMHPDWVRSLRDQCAVANVPFFFKQWGAFRVWQENGHEELCLYQSPSDGRLDAMPGVEYSGFERCRVEKLSKSQSGNMLDGKLYLEFPLNQ